MRPHGAGCSISFRSQTVAALHFHRLYFAFLVPVVLIVVGTAGYCLIEGWGLLDAVYMTVITLTTVGFNEVHALSTPGRIFTILLALGGIFTLFYAATVMIRAVVSGDIQNILGRQRMERSLELVHDHLIVCGYGRMGRLVCQELSQQKLPFVVIDRQPEALEKFAVPHGIPLHGDAASDQVLKRAGIDRARALVTVVASDPENLYIAMTARLLNEKLFIVARADDAHCEQKLMRAGANRVISPYQIGGRRVAQAVLRPTVTDFIDLATRTEHVALQIEETQLAGNSTLVGATIKECRLRQEHEVIVVAIKKHMGKMVFNPASDTVLEKGDTLVVIGDRAHLDRLEKMAQG
jgi:voltage-gated potassium channel